MRLYESVRKSRWFLTMLVALVVSLAAGLVYLINSPVNDGSAFKFLTSTNKLLLKTSDERDAIPRDFTMFQEIAEENRDVRSDLGLTSVEKSSVQLVSPKGRDFEVGDVIKYRILSRDPSGLDRTTGGDFYFATLSSARDPQASTAGKVTDHDNGTYDVELLAAWPGRARFNLTLVHTGGAVQLLENTIWTADDRTQWFGRFTEDGRSAITRCFLRHGGAWVGMCEYPAPHALGSTSLFCRKPPDISCKAFVSYASNWDAIIARIAELTKGKEYLFESPYYMQPMQPSNEILTIEGSGSPRIHLPPCKPDQEIPAIQGYWKDGRWTSLLCKLSNCTKTSLEKCLYNTEVVLLGDSTTRQWLIGLLELIGKPTTYITNEGSNLMRLRSYFNELKLGVYFQFHPNRCGSGLFYNIDAMRYEVDVLDELNRTDCRYIVAVSPWCHFAQWRRDVYIERVLLLRKAVIRLKKRCPNVPVVIKGPHPREHPSYTERSLTSDYILKEIGRINAKAFRGTGAFFLPIWDMNLSHHVANTCHMPQTVIRQELLMFFGYACEK